MAIKITNTRPGKIVPYKEASLQRAVARYLDQLAGAGMLAFNHPANEGKRTRRNGGMLKAAGMKAGEPDCVIYLRGGRTIFIELKTLRRYLSKEQKARHAELTRLGFHVYTVKAETPSCAVNHVRAILRNYGIHA